MLAPIREGAFRWSTPDPADDWIMVGHLFVRDTGVVLVDPPMVPGLLDDARKLGKLEAVLLTAQNHTRAAKFISKRTGIPVYLPESIPEAVEPWEAARVKEIGEFQTYKAGRVLGVPGSQVRRGLRASDRQGRGSWWETTREGTTGGGC